MLQIPTDAYRHLTRLLDDGVIAWVAAIEAQPGHAFYITSDPKDIRYAGRTWQSFPMKVGGQRKGGDGSLSGVDLTISNIGRHAMRYLESGAWDQGTVVLRIVLVGDPDGVDLGIEMVYSMQSVTATRDAVTLNLGQPNYFRKRFPARIYLRDRGMPGIPRNVA